MILLAHGLEGSPEGGKAQALRAAGLPLVAPDGRGKPLAERIVALEAALLSATGPVVLVGSSYGGLASAWLAEQHGARIAALVLLAPALHHSEPPVADASRLAPPPGVPTVVIHATADAVVPVSVSRAYAARAPATVTLTEVDDDHGLGGHRDLIVAEVSRLWRKVRW